jgi:hypothetical protein
MDSKIMPGAETITMATTTMATTAEISSTTITIPASPTARPTA